MTLTTLPNGMTLETPRSSEAQVIYHELFEDCPYLRNGVAVADGDTVLDVGANVGAFSALLAERYAGLRIVLFEPIPETFAMLERNAARLMGGAEVTLVNAGVSSAPGRARFELLPGSSLTASAEPRREMAASAREAGTQAQLRALLADAEQAGLVRPRVTRTLAAGLDRRAARPILLGATRATQAVVAARRRVGRRHVECTMTTISEALRTHAIEAVDLVKIDVEGAEWAVLEGIAPDDWPRLRQLVLEVHDVDGRVARIRRLLEDKGYRVVVEQEDWATLRLLGMHNVYAVREGA